MKSHEISALILTRDEERNLPRALGSVPAGIQVLIFDGESRDRTRDIAQSAGARVIDHPWKGFVEARRFALTQVQTPWAFALDADEALDGRLCGSLLAADGTCAGYTVRRDTYFCGKPMRLWRGEELLRMFRVDAARVEAQPAAGGDADLHERYIVHGSIGKLEGTLLHFSYPDVASYRRKYDRYTTIEAQGLPKRSVAIAVMYYIVAVLIGLARFGWLLIGRGSVLDGWRGFYIAFWSAMYPAVVTRKSL